MLIVISEWRYLLLRSLFAEEERSAIEKEEINGVREKISEIVQSTLLLSKRGFDLFLILGFNAFYQKKFFIPIKTKAPARNPTTASQDIFLKYQMKSILSIPIAATPAADPMISILPPVPAA